MIRVVGSCAPEHRNELHILRESGVHVGIPVIGPVYLTSLTVPVLDVLGWVVEWEAAFGEVCCCLEGEEG